MATEKDLSPTNRESGLAPSVLVAVDSSARGRTYSRMLFGGFLEHFHRQIYGGIFEPGSPLSDTNGFRRDVMAAIKELRTPIVRWPGGCFVSAYHWKDGVGKDRPSDYATCMLRSTQPEASITTVEHLLESTGFKGRITIAFDEWNLRGWHHPSFTGNFKARDRNDLNATYTMADALFSACFLNSCLRHADTVKMANIASLVNTRGPLFVHPRGIVRRTTFHVLRMYANLLGSRVAKTTVTSEAFKHGAGTVPAVDAVVTCDPSRKKWQAALVNRHPTAPARCVIQFDGPPISGKWPATVLSGDSTEAFNDIEHPDRVTPRNLELEIENGAVQLPPHSVTILEFYRNPLPERLILNGGFESGVAQDRPEAWEPTRWGEGDYRASWSDDSPQAGRRCVRLETATGADCAWKQRVEVEPHTRYRLAGWIRTESVVPGTGRGAFLNIQEIQEVKTQVITGTTDWVRVEMVFDSGSHETVQVNCLLGGWGRSTGKSWYDDLTLDRESP